jgi:hypothetical protein
MKHRISFLVATAMVVAVMMVGGISLSSAQPSGGPTCTDKWFKDWYVWDSEDGPWLYYWWYQYCQDPSQGDAWFRAYHSWDWGEAL